METAGPRLTRLVARDGHPDHAVAASVLRCRLCRERLETAMAKLRRLDEEQAHAAAIPD